MKSSPTLAAVAAVTKTATTRNSLSSDVCTTKNMSHYAVHALWIVLTKMHEQLQAYAPRSPRSTPCCFLLFSWRQTDTVIFFFHFIMTPESRPTLPRRGLLASLPKRWETGKCKSWAIQTRE